MPPKLRTLPRKIPRQERSRATVEAILDAAAHVLVKDGFDGASTNRIADAAGVSIGSLYQYFPSKEALIAGISERNRADAVASFAQVEQAPDFFDGLAQLARHHLVDRGDSEVGLCAEIMSESRRNADIARLYQEIESDIKRRIAGLLETARARGEIRADVDIEAAATVLMVLGDGMSWRRSVEKSFDAERVLPLILKMVHCLLAKPGACGESGEERR